jgi:hypothetical protein
VFLKILKQTTNYESARSEELEERYDHGDRSRHDDQEPFFPDKGSNFTK